MSVNFTIRTKNIYKKDSKRPFLLSRSKVELFVECPRCFWLDRVKGIARPKTFPFNLNNAVDTLLKKEFDQLRMTGTAHALMERYTIDAIPYAHPDLDTWRNPFKGIRFYHQKSNLVVFGGIDDVWVNSKGEIHIVDYKATSKDGDVSINAHWQKGYKRQVELYQWLFKNNGFNVSPYAYFVYANGLRDRERFDAKLEFNVVIFDYKCDTSWIEPTLFDIGSCLSSSDIPDMSNSCDYCMYNSAVTNHLHTNEQTLFS